MKLQYIVHTTWDEKAMTAYAAVNQAGQSTPLSRVVSRVVALAILAFGIVVMIVRGFQLVHSFILLIGLLLLFSQPMGLARSRRRLMRALGGKRQQVDYRFGENGFDAAPAGGAAEHLSYDALTRLVETKDYLFLFVGPGKAHILGKADFAQGDSAGLLAFLTEKTGKQPEKLEL